MKIIIQLLFLSWLLFAFPSQAGGATPFSIKTIAQDLGTPWGMAFLSADSLLVTEREGTLLRLDLKSGQISNIEGLPWDIVVLGQGGLLDVAVNKTSDWIYFSYSKNVDGQGATPLSRAKLHDNTLTDWQDLLVSKSRTRTSHHFAGRLAFDQQQQAVKEERLLSTLGERIRNVVQGPDDLIYLSTDTGKILMLSPNNELPE